VRENAMSRDQVPNPSYIVERKEQLKRIKFYICGEFPQSINIVGDPRIGKTAILDFIYRKESSFCESRCAFILMHMAGYPNQIPLVFWQNLVALTEQKASRVLQVDPENVNREDSGELYEMLEERIDLLINSPKIDKVVFLIDDFDLFMPVFDLKDYAWLRALAFQFKENLAFILSSSDSIKSLYFERFGEKTVSPFPNILTNMNLSLLDRNEAVELINNTASLYGDYIPTDEDIEFLIEICGCHPDYLMVACRYYFAARANNIGAVIDNTFRDNISSDIIFDDHLKTLSKELFLRRTREDKKAIGSLVMGDSVKEIDEMLIRNLEKRYGIIDRERKDTGLFSKVFWYWVKKEISPDPKYDTDYDMRIFDYEQGQRSVTIGKRSEVLTPLEDRLFGYLYRNIGNVCSIEELLENVWGPGKTKSVVEKAVNRLRTKIEDDPGRPRHIISIHGEGYMLRDHIN